MKDNIAIQKEDKMNLQSMLNETAKEIVELTRISTLTEELKIRLHELLERRQIILDMLGE